MTFKKTITISIVFHLCFFSAALLLSAGLLKGNGDTPDVKVFFVSLEAEVNKSVDGSAVAVKTVVLQKAKIVAQEVSPPVIAKTKKDAVEIVVVEKAEEVLEDMLSEKSVPVIEESDAIDPVNESMPLLVGETGAVALNENVEGVQVSYNQPLSDEIIPFSGRHATGLSPDAVKLISMAIERVKTYPVIARKRGIEGTVHVSFKVREDGKPQEIEILKSSGFNILDKATVRVVKRAAPYPFVDMRVEVPVAYRLKNY